MPAIEDDRPVSARVAVAPDRPAAGFAAPRGGFADAAPELKLSIAIAHGRLVSWVPGNGHLSRSWRVLAAGFGGLGRAVSPINAPNREPVIGSLVLTSSMAFSAAISAGGF